MSPHSDAQRQEPRARGGAVSGLACDSVSLTALCVPVESNELRPHVRPTRAGTLGDRRAPRPLPRGAGPGCRLESPVALLPTDQGPSGVSPLPTPPPCCGEGGRGSGGHRENAGFAPTPVEFSPRTPNLFSPFHVVFLLHTCCYLFDNLLFILVMNHLLKFTTTECVKAGV